MEKVCRHLAVARDPGDNLLKYRRPVDVDGRDKPGHDEYEQLFAALP
jgi:hypothetical protein